VQRSGRVVASESWQDRFVRDQLDKLAREAGQERWDAEADAQRIEFPADPLPDSFDDALAKALEAVGEALADGKRQLILEQDTSAGDETYNMLSRTIKFVQPLLPGFADVVSADLDSTRVQLVFPDEGTAAYARANWALPAGTVCSSAPRLRLEPCAALVMVAPTASEVPTVQRVIEELPVDTVFLLVNPKLVDMQSTGYGLVGRDLRNMVEETFTNVFSLTTLFGGALYHVYPGAWSGWRENESAEGGYELVYSRQKRPSGDELTDILSEEEGDEDGPSSGPSFGDKFASFVKGFQAMR